jgi:hypothetical protein
VNVDGFGATGCRKDMVVGRAMAVVVGGGGGISVGRRCLAGMAIDFGGGLFGAVRDGLSGLCLLQVKVGRHSVEVMVVC